MRIRGYAVGVAMLAGACSMSACAAELLETRSVDVQYTPLSLNDLGPTDTGAILTAAWALRSKDPSFGGFSGLDWDPQSNRLLAVTDRGGWWVVELELDAAGVLAGLSESRMGVLNDSSGRPLEKKANADAEGLARLADGRWLVSFEQDHRVDLYPAVDGLPSGRARSLPKDFPALDGNSGLEALAVLADGRTIAIAEKKPKKGSVTGWVSDAKRLSWTPRQFRGTFGYRPTGLDSSPGGGLLFLERMFSPLTGRAARVSWIPDPADVESGVIPSRMLFAIVPPMPVDNFESLAAYPDGAGGVWVFLLSDDNFHTLQRTLLLQVHCPKSCFQSNDG